MVDLLSKNTYLIKNYIESRNDNARKMPIEKTLEINLTFFKIINYAFFC
ncbi:hypothetical protein T285_07995 [Lactobacillus johnsonii N6.2]|uniref:Uncharacterized protein n=1 Tax=Lactobacillus johnsonii N6.2 TaxID=1408186 RepID=A0A7D9N8W2_LACJH|nr:hypothetical protein T285_07995 [Lactobacillus johnsonii N6.2]